MGDRRVVVAARLPGRSQTAPPHDEQQGARDLLGRGPQPVERRALCLAEPGATAQAAVALMSAHMAIAHDMRLLAVAIGARRTGSRWTHRVAPPTLPSSNSYASPVTTEKCLVVPLFELLRKGLLCRRRLSSIGEELMPDWRVSVRLP